MLRNDNTPTRSLTVQGNLYEEAGAPDFEFVIPQPFTPEMVSGVDAAGASPAGVAQQLNQVLAENLRNNMAARVKKAAKDKADLPTQADMDSLYDSYDFTGMRASAVSLGSMFDRILYKVAGNFLRKLFKRKGYQDMPAPVTVAKKTAETTGPQEISYEDFESEIARLMEGEGPWAENEAFIEVRNSLIEDARAEEAAMRKAEAKAEEKLAAVSSGL